MRFDGRAAIVTGASSGIGRAVSLELVRRGTHVLAVARRAERLDELRAEAAHLAPRARCEPWVADVAAPGAAEQAVARAEACFGRLDLLVNNAGIPKHKPIHDLDAGEVDDVMAVNFLAPVRLTLAALPPMLRRGEGSIVLVSSAAARLAPPREAVYAASKAALSSFGEGLVLDLHGSGIHAGVVHVGPIDTEIWERARADAPVRYAGPKHPELVARAIVRLVERRLHEVTVPRSLRLVFLANALFPGLVRRGARRFDPLDPAVVAAARTRARAGAIDRERPRGGEPAAGGS